MKKLLGVLFAPLLFLLLVSTVTPKAHAQANASEAVCAITARDLMFFVGAVQQVNGQWRKCVFNPSTHSSSWQPTTETRSSGTGYSSTDFVDQYSVMERLYSTNYVNDSFKVDLHAATTKNDYNVGGYTAMVQADQICHFGVMTAGALPCATPANSSQAYIQNLNQQSAMSGLGSYMASMYDNRPADLAYWVQDTGETLGFIPKSANAQGIGFTGLSPLLNIWKAFRNIAYALMAIVMIVVGFMVMLRKKIDPKTVVTVQNALPRIVFTLLLITFSYAIAGIMIDLMYLVIALGVGILNTTFTNGATPSIFGIKADLVNGGFMDLIWAVFAPLINNTGPTGTANQAFQFATSGDQWNRIIQNGVVGNLLNSVSVVGNASLGTLLQAIIAIAFLFGFVRIFFLLLTSYIQIILSVIVGPIQMLMDALPGGEGFSSWLKNLFINLIPFPITIFMLTIGNAIAGSNLSGPLWQPPFLPQTGGGVGGFAITVIWLGIIMSVPTIVNGIKEAIKTKAPIPAGLGALFGPVGAGAGQVFQMGYQASFIATPLLHKVKPSEPLGRGIDAAKGGIPGAVGQATGGSAH